MDKFTETRQKYEQLKTSYDAGKIAKDDFQKSVEALAFQDDKGETWQIGVASGEWYRLQEGEWVKDSPPDSDGIPDDFGSSLDFGDGPAASPRPDYGDSPASPPPPPPSASGSPAPPPPPAAEPAAPVYTMPGSDAGGKTKKKRKGCLIIGAVVLVVVACLVGAFLVGRRVFDSGNSPISTSSSSTSRNQSTTFMDVENQSSMDICGVYISPSSSEDWGSNWLSSGEVLYPGDYVRYEMTIGEIVDIYAEDCQGNMIDSLYEIEIPEEGVTVTYSDN